MSNKILYKLIIGIFIILLFSFILFQNTKQIKKYNSNERILFLGDSITSRYDLNKYYSNYNVINSGIGGNQTSDILNDLDNRVYKHNPTKIFILIGTNDLVYSGLDNDSIKNNIEQIVDKTYEKIPNAQIYLESIYPVNSNVNEQIVEGRTNDNIKILNSKIESICKDNKCTYINMFDILKNKDGDLKRIYTVDGLHLNNIGYITVTKELLKYIKE